MGEPATSDGHLLGGRVRYSQPVTGFRSGIEPVLLAAAVPARPGQRVLEGGSGAGAALLCLAARVPGLFGVGVERDAALASLATRNAAANGWPDLRFIAADIGAAPGLEPGSFDHACANPPYHPSGGTASPEARRESAKRAPAGLFDLWAATLAAALRPRGTLTFILATGSLPAGMAAFTAAGCPPTALLPLWPKPGRAAKLLLLQGVKGSRTPVRVLPGLVLHNVDGGYTPQAEAILRHGAALPWQDQASSICG